MSEILLYILMGALIIWYFFCLFMAVRVMREKPKNVTHWASLLCGDICIAAGTLPYACEEPDNHKGMHAYTTAPGVTIHWDDSQGIPWNSYYNKPSKEDSNESDSSSETGGRRYDDRDGGPGRAAKPFRD